MKLLRFKEHAAADRIRLCQIDRFKERSFRTRIARIAGMHVAKHDPSPAARNDRRRALRLDARRRLASARDRYLWQAYSAAEMDNRWQPLWEMAACPEWPL